MSENTVSRSIEDVLTDEDRCNIDEAHEHAAEEAPIESSDTSDDDSDA